MVNFNMALHPSGVLFGPVKDWAREVPNYFTNAIEKETSR